MVGVALVFTGCGAARPGADVVAADVWQTLPAQWSAAPSDQPGGPLTAHFLTLIEDTRLEALIAEAFEANHDLLASARRLDAAVRGLIETKASSWPELVAELRRTRTNLTFDGTIATEERLVLASSWEIDLWGRLAKLDRANVAEVERLALDFAAARDALGARVIQSWLELVSIRSALQVEETRVVILERLQATIQRRYRTGIGTLDDLAVARAATDVAMANVVALHAEREAARRALEVYLGRPPRASLSGTATWPEIGSVQVGYPLSALLARNDVAAAVRRLEAADAAAAAAVRARLPSLRLSAEGGRGRGTTVSDAISVGSAWTLLTGVTQPIFQRGLLRARSDARRLEFEAASEELVAVVWRAAAEVEDALAREQALLRQRSLLTSAAAKTARAIRIQEERYRLGLSSVVELLSTRSNELDLRRQVIAMEAELLGNRIALALAVGASFAEVES